MKNGELIKDDRKWGTLMKLIVFAVLIIPVIFSIADAKYSGGSGTADDPYQIANADDLLALAADVNDYNKCFILTADINLDPNLPGGQVFTTAVIPSTYRVPFTGIFDGAGHKIANMTIKTYDSGEDSIGLFDYITGGQVKNLRLKNVSIEVVLSSCALGGLAGCSVNSSITNCSSTGTVDSGNNSECIGGLVGDNCGDSFGSIIDSSSTCNVTSGSYSSSIGGLAGRNVGTINRCWSTGIVSGGTGSMAVGGLVGDNIGNTSNCFSTGAVSGYDIGGLVGVNDGDGSNISNCYSTGNVSGEDDSEYIGGLVGCYEYGGNVSNSYFLVTSGPDNGSGQPLTDEQMKQQSSFSGWDFVGEAANGTEDIWIIREGIDYPKLGRQPLLLQVAKCKVTAGSKDNSDTISISGLMDATGDDISAASSIEVTIDSDHIVSPCVQTFTINDTTFKNGKFKCSGTENLSKISFTFNTATSKFSFTARNVDLLGLDCPLTIEIEIGDYICTAEVNEAIVNGSKKPIPINLMNGVKDVLRFDKCKAKQGKKLNSDRLSVKGGIAVGDIDDSDLASEDVVITWGNKTFTIPEGGFKAAKAGKSYKCSKVNANEGGVTSGQIDLDKGTFTITVTDANASPVEFESGVGFGISFAPSFDEIVELNLPYIVNYAFDYLGDYLTPQLITYTDETGQVMEVSGFPGQVQLFVTTETTAWTVQTFAHTNGGAVIAQIPWMGYYLVGVTPGDEASFIAAANADASVLLAIPNMPLATASDVVYLRDLLGPHGELPVIPNLKAQVGNKTYLYINDDFVKASLSCGNGPTSHGAGVDYVASHNLSGTGQQIHDSSISGTTIVPNDIVAANATAIKDMTFNKSGRAVVNFSQQGDPMCPGDQCCSEEIYRTREILFLKGLAHQLDALPDNLLQQTVFVVSAGNGVCNGAKGLDLSLEIKKLHEQFPRVFGLGGGPHMIIGGGQGNTSGTAYTNYNYASDSEDANGNPLMVYAPARGVPVNGTGCKANGTSFAAPAVSNVISQVLSAHPNLTVAQITHAFMEAARKNTYWLPTVEQVNAELETTLSIGTTGTGSGTVTANPLPNEPSGTYTIGTVVTLTARPDTGSTFAGWSGDVTGTITSVKIEMDGNKSVTATFNTTPHGGTGISGTWTGSYTLTSNISYYCSNIPNLYNSGTITMTISQDTDGLLTGNISMPDLQTWDDSYGMNNCTLVPLPSTSGPIRTGFIAGNVFMIDAELGHYQGINILDFTGTLNRNAITGTISYDGTGTFSVTKQ